jgi:hypothetical protein
VRIVVPLAILAALAGVLLLVAVLFTARRFSLSRRGASFDCSVRKPDGSWSLGVARYGDDELDWFRIFSFSLRPRTRWGREDLVVVSRRPTDGVEATAVLPQSVVISCTHRGRPLDLAMSDDAYTGLASWLESAPPGRYAHVT